MTATDAFLRQQGLLYWQESIWIMDIVYVFFFSLIDLEYGHFLCYFFLFFFSVTTEEGDQNPCYPIQDNREMPFEYQLIYVFNFQSQIMFKSIGIMSQGSYCPEVFFSLILFLFYSFFSSFIPIFTYTRYLLKVNMYRAKFVLGKTDIYLSLIGWNNTIKGKCFVIEII